MIRHILPSPSQAADSRDCLRLELNSTLECAQKRRLKPAPDSAGPARPDSSPRPRAMEILENLLVACCNAIAPMTSIESLEMENQHVRRARRVEDSGLRVAGSTKHGWREGTYQDGVRCFGDL